MSKGIFYCVGVGSGDPELMTLKAVRLIKENEFIAVPTKDVNSSVAYNIAVRAVPELSRKTIIPVPMPMTHDKGKLDDAHKANAALVMKPLEQGQNVVYLTLGDPTVYSSFTYLQRILEHNGFDTQMINGVTSFTAAAARLNIPLVQGRQSLYITPTPKAQNICGDTTVYMKMGRHSDFSHFQHENKNLYAVENCGMENEKIHIGTIPHETGYFTVIIEKNED